ncbi:MAG TPA: hypothetical protein DCL44_06890 [Elusimicrobia bacterium]|nr:hypothetical protein [Elusimicrobiota bacterium]
MDTKTIREHQIKRLDKHSQTFRRLFRREISEYYTPAPMISVFDLFRFFADLHVPSRVDRRDFVSRKYGSEAVDLIDEILP